MSDAVPRVCAICGQVIPRSAKLSLPQEDDDTGREVCLRCRIRLAENEKGR